MSGHRELRALTGARGVAAWLVVLFHIRLSIGGVPAAVEAVVAKGYLAVDFFFLLSGFVIAMSWGARLHEGGRATIGAFLRRRIARIWPLHATMLAATGALAMAMAASGHADPAAFPLAQLPLQALLLQNWGFTDRLAWNVPAWSISAEFGAYLLFPVTAIAIDTRRLSTPALLALAALLLATLGHAIGPARPLGFLVERFGLLRCVCEFLTGTLVFALWRRGVPRAAVATAVAALAGLWAAGTPEAFAVPALFAALLLLLAQTEGGANPLSHAVPHALGEISYATYLAHYPLWIGFKLLFVADPAAVPAGTIAAYLLLVLTASLALHRLVELPAQRRIAGQAALPRDPRALSRPPRRPVPPPAPRRSPR